jgi:SAM-dependent methyltransferase
MHDLENKKIQDSYRKQYQPLLSSLNVVTGTKVLDIGSGLGFIKPMIESRGGIYLGVEPDKASYDAACELYGHEGFIMGFFPDAISINKFDLILVLSCVDEVPDKLRFLEGIRLILDQGDCKAYIAVRNKSFFVNRFKTTEVMKGRSARSLIGARDLKSTEWENLFQSSGLVIIEKGKFLRPWITGFKIVGIKNIAYKLLSIILPVNYSYMLYYILDLKRVK